MTGVPYTFLQASYSDGQVALWCKNAKDDYELVHIPYNRHVFVALSSKKARELDIAGGTPVTKTLSTKAISGLYIEESVLTDAQKEALIQKGVLFEHDIDTVRQFLMRHGLTTGVRFLLDGTTITVQDKVESLRLAAFDIETYSPHYTIDPEQYPVLSIAVRCDDESVVFTWKYNSKHTYVHTCADEKDMLARAMAWLEEKRPDLLTGYNSDKFDLWYMYGRARALGVDLTFAGQTITVHRNKAVRLPGVVHVDLYAFCRNALRTTLRTNSLSLDAVAGEVLGKQKHDVDLNSLPDAWDTGKQMDTFYAYNKEDTDITYELTRRLLPNMRAFCDLISIDLVDITRNGFATLVEHYLMTRAYQLDQCIPPLPSQDQMSSRRGRPNTGGYVHEPTPGIYEHIVVSDFSSLYPTIIVSHNLDPTPNPDSDTLGFIPDMINSLIEERKKIKQQLKEMSSTDDAYIIVNAHSQNIKVLANAMYGYLSFLYSRWYNKQTAQQITSLGRQYVKQAIKQTQDAGFHVVYSDTDSLFFLQGDASSQQVLDHIQTLNKDLPGVMHLDLEGIFARGIFVATRGGEGAKKKYALLKEDGSLKIIGFEAIRNDWCDLARATQKKVLQMVLTQQPTEKIHAHVVSVLDALTQGKVNLEDVTLRTKMSKYIDEYKSIGPAVAVAKRMQDAGKKVTPGTIIPYVIAGQGKTLAQKARMPEEISAKDIDKEYYIEHQIKPVLESILTIAGVKLTLSGNGQRGLGEF